jgi:hypothetical protein
LGRKKEYPKNIYIIGLNFVVSYLSQLVVRVKMKNISLVVSALFIYPSVSLAQFYGGPLPEPIVLNQDNGVPAPHQGSAPSGAWLTPTFGNQQNNQYQGQDNGVPAPHQGSAPSGAWLTPTFGNQQNNQYQGQDNGVPAPHQGFQPNGFGQGLNVTNDGGAQQFLNFVPDQSQERTQNRAPLVFVPSPPQSKPLIFSQPSSSNAYSQPNLRLSPTAVSAQTRQAGSQSYTAADYASTGLNIVGTVKSGILCATTFNPIECGATVAGYVQLWNDPLPNGLPAGTQPQRSSASSFVGYPQGMVVRGANVAGTGISGGQCAVAIRGRNVGNVLQDCSSAAIGTIQLFPPR